MTKIGFFGTPEIASFCLNRLFDDFEISFVVTTEDKRSGRNQKVKFSETKNLTISHNIDVLQPKDLKDPEFIKKIKEYNADIFVVVAYGKIIPREIFDYPPLKTINLHPSLLPKYRGAAPIQWAIINGEGETGVTVQLINEKLDAGDIVLQKKISLSKDITSGELYEIVKPLGAKLLCDAIAALKTGSIQPEKQNENDVSFCKKIDRETAHINWNLTTAEIHNLVRGLNPKPAAWTTFRTKNIKIWKTSIPDDINIEVEPGIITIFQKKRLLVGTHDGSLEIIDLQPENKKRMNGLSFINGYRLQQSDTFV